MGMTKLLITHLTKGFCRVGVGRLEARRKFPINPGIILLSPNGQGQNFLFIESVEGARHEERKV